ncbi:MAG: GNAT family protein [Acidimicrobiales bacterium]
MALLADRLSDGAIELRRSSLDEMDQVLDAVDESWTELHNWLYSFREPVNRESYVAATRDDIRCFDEDQDWRYHVIDLQDGAFVGMANLYRLSGPERVAIGYWVRTSRTRRGYASRSTRLLVDTAFSVPTFQVVEISMDVTNLASARVAEKLGFRRVAEFTRDIRVPGHSGRGALWEMTRPDWTLMCATPKTSDG